MSDGRTHARITGALVLPSAAVAGVLGGFEPALFAALGCASGWFVEPDLDVDGLTRSEWRIVERLHIVGMLWVTFWYPYARALPHRSKFSHWPVLGTLLRCLYLAGGVWLLERIVSGIQLDWQALLFDERAHWWFIGLCVADAAHYVADQVSSARKRRLTARRKRRKRRLRK
jgi:uncharacterized metal-binding protein